MTYLIYLVDRHRQVCSCSERGDPLSSHNIISRLRHGSMPGEIYTERVLKLTHSDELVLAER